MKPAELSHLQAYIKDPGQAFRVVAGSEADSDTGFTAPGGASTVVPTWQIATQDAANHEALAPVLGDDGTLTFTIYPVATALLTGATLCTEGLTATFTYTADGETTTLPLALGAGNGELWTASVRVTPSRAAVIRGVLLDASPNAVVTVTQRLPVAIPITDDYVRAHWNDPEVKKALTAATYGDGMTLPQFLAESHDYFAPAEGPRYLVAQALYTSRIDSPALPGFLQHAVAFHGATHNYYQASDDPGRVHFLPDGFQLGTDQAGAPQLSLLQFTSTDGTIHTVEATFRFWAPVVIDENRITAATTALSQQIGRPVTLTPLPDTAATATLAISIPTADATGSVMTTQPKASIGLATGVRDEKTLTLQAFRSLWDAIFSSDPQQPIMRGTVEVRISGGKFVEEVSFEGRMPAGVDPITYFNAIVDKSNDVTFTSAIKVTTFAQVLSDLGVAALTATFGTSSVTLTADQLCGTATAQRPIKDILLGAAGDGTPYSLHVVTPTAQRCCQRMADSDQIYLTEQDVTSCDGPCG